VYIPDEEDQDEESIDGEHQEEENDTE